MYYWLEAMLNILHTCRHVSRSTLIEFSLPEIGHDQSVDEQEVWDNLELIKDKASGCIGLCIRLGHMLEEEGYKDIRTSYAPSVQQALAGVQPRVITGYATVLWFTSKVPNLGYIITMCISPGEFVLK